MEVTDRRVKLQNLLERARRLKRELQGKTIKALDPEKEKIYEQLIGLVGRDLTPDEQSLFDDLLAQLDEE